MNILVWDSNSERKQQLEEWLVQKSLLLSENIYSDITDMAKLIECSSIIVVMDHQGLEKFQQTVKGKIIVCTNESDLADVAQKYLINISSKNLEEVCTKVYSVINQALYDNYLPVTVNFKMNEMLNLAKRAAKTNAAILIEGDTGSGKEVLAKYVHYHSKKNQGPFIAVNCAAIPESMIEAVLFGYEKGSFTNALKRHVGKFEQANNGTLFLDEIAEMPIELQSKLLRVLQEKEIERIGGTETISVNFRVIAATNKNLKKQVELNHFREDLYYRLNVVNLSCLSLRERPEDIMPLVDYFIRLYSQDLYKKNIRLDDDVVKALQYYNWPGNIRELQNKIQRAMIVDDDGVIGFDDIGIDEENLDKYDPNQTYALHEKEAEVIIDVLKKTKGCRGDAAKLLKISPRTLRYKLMKMKENGLTIP